MNDVNSNEVSKVLTPQVAGPSGLPGRIIIFQKPLAGPW